MASTNHYDAPALELLVHCQLELDRIQKELSRVDSSESCARLARVERAVSWLRSGNYGACGVCGRRIPDADLRASPERLACRSCANPVKTTYSALDRAAW